MLQENVSMLMDELQTAIKSNRGHLAKLGPQLQTEQEQFSLCMSANTLKAFQQTVWSQEACNSRHEGGDESQKQIFGTDGNIYSKAYPQFALTYLENLTAQWM